METVVFFLDDDGYLGKCFHCHNNDDVRKAVTEICDGEEVNIDEVMEEFEESCSYNVQFGTIYCGGLE